jgi:hypothetical protein
MILIFNMIFIIMTRIINRKVILIEGRKRLRMRMFEAKSKRLRK